LGVTSASFVRSASNDACSYVATWRNNTSDSSYFLLAFRGGGTARKPFAKPRKHAPYERSRVTADSIVEATARISVREAFDKVHGCVTNKDAGTS
jgi:hypothetical protein